LLFARARNTVAKILIVEDSPDNMKLFRALLTLQGHEVMGLHGGEGLLETIGREPPALVLMDIQLPGKDGFTLLQEIRSSPQAAVPVLALTAHAMSGDREQCLAAGMDEYLSKPISSDALYAVVEKFSGGAKANGKARGPLTAGHAVSTATEAPTEIM
jgi:CheY-like chemotaxis protein